jgi:hypothetical protein
MLSQTTALVHEAYLRLARIKDLEVSSRPLSTKRARVAAIS